MIMKNYDHKKIEKKWRKLWEKSGIYKTTDDISQTSKPKSYVLDMFPYPSGEGLHVGHPKGYIATDIYSRYKKMTGHNVLHPMGWDAFGLPAENYAIKNKVHPSVAVEKNIKRFKEQLSVLGFDYDWEREINTTDPEFYKWTQWIFLQMFEKGLAYESNESINWCPECKTGLANEDLEGDVCERCGTVVEQKPIRQWVLKITDYADKMLEGLDELDWPESIKESQRNWIGRSDGALLKFQVTTNKKQTNSKLQETSTKLEIEVFTTRPDTLFGCTYCVLAPEHELVERLKEQIENWDEVCQYIGIVAKKTDIERTANKEKTGVELKEVKAINPANGEEIPIFIADYVLAHYGTGAIMAVPAHDERDKEFAEKFGLGTKEVVVPFFTDDTVRKDKPTIERHNVLAILQNKKGETLCLDWSGNGWKSFLIGGVEGGENVVDAGEREILEESGYKNVKFIKHLGGQSQLFFAPHKDINRKAIVFAVLFELENDERVEVAKEELEQHTPIWIKNENVEDFINLKNNLVHYHRISQEGVFSDTGVLLNSGKFDGMDSEEAKSAITEFVGGEMKSTYKLRDWVFSRQRYWGEPIPLIHCVEQGSSCGVVAVPEKDLPVKLPVVESYEPTGTGESPLAGILDWVNVKCPKCGGAGKRETNTMPQWAGSSWYYLRYIDPKNSEEFVDKEKEKYWSPVNMYVGGAEHATRHLVYARFWHRFLYDIGSVSYKEPFKRLQHVGLINAEDGRKMSKRWGNVINPDDIVATYGADTLRLYEMFMGPFSQSVSWSTDSIIGPRRFLEKVWKLQEKVKKTGLGTSGTKLEGLLHKTIKKVTEDIESFGFNTAISQMMILVNEMAKDESLRDEDYKTFLILLAPFAPHVAEELWESLGNTTSIHLEEWPKYDESLIVEETVSYALQVNGKVRDQLEVDASTTEKEIKRLAKESEIIKKWIDGKTIKKEIFVKARLINIVVV